MGRRLRVSPRNAEVGGCLKSPNSQHKKSRDAGSFISINIEDLLLTLLELIELQLCFFFIIPPFTNQHFTDPSSESLDIFLSAHLKGKVSC